MAKSKAISVSNQKGGVGKSTTVYNLGVSLVLDCKKVLLLDVDLQCDLAKMLVQRRTHNLLLPLANAMDDVVSGTMLRDHLEIIHHREGFYFVPGNSTQAVYGQCKVGLRLFFSNDLGKSNLHGLLPLLYSTQRR